MKPSVQACLCLVALFGAERVYALPPTVTTLHAFSGPDGSGPNAPVIQASDGNFYGTTIHGGDDGHGCVQGCDGTVFKVTPRGQFTLLHTFVGGGTTPAYQNGRNPWGGLVEGADGYLYGTTFLGGVATRLSDGATVSADGTVYRISKAGQFQKIHDLNSNIQPEGGEPQGSLVFGSDGYLYGTTTNPPAFPQIFRMSTDGVYTTIKSLYNTGLGSPVNGLVRASDGNMYGVATGGIYRVTPPYGFFAVYFFNSPTDGSGNSEVIQATDGNLYGATYPGPGNTGFLFRIGLDGNFQKILNLAAATTGVGPNALVEASDGTLWGTTVASSVGGVGGKVYRIMTDGTLLDSVFLTMNQTGIQPQAPLIQGIDGKLYGTASGYGRLPNGQGASGTVFVVDAGLAPRLMSIAITAPNSSIPNGTAEQFTATGTYGDNSVVDITTQVTWSSSNSGVATIASTGLATATATGSTNITASLNGITSNTFALTVAPGALTSISITGPASVVAGSTRQFLATGHYSDNSTSNITTQVTWNSSNPAAATFGAVPGLATAIAAGSSDISASLNGVASNTLTLSVTAQTVPTVMTYRVLFGSQSYSLGTAARNRLPWQITGIQVVFSRPIATGNVNSLGGVTATALTGLGTDTLTWTISPLTKGAFATSLAGSGANALKDASGNPLGAGAGFSQSFKVLLGDFNDDGVVSSADMVGVNNATVTPYNIFADINGDGAVTITDVQIVRARIGTSQP